jgi:3-hydroxyisobutyrate dehydrogenase-like beta-hydroxyacid dehydrogenase
MNVGFIGLGRMGSAMVRRLLGAGHHVTVFNRTREKADALHGDGAAVAASVAEACRADAVVTMLADDGAVEAVANGPGGVVANLPAGALHISSSTISVALAQRLAAAHQQAGQRFVSAPVFGRPDAAEAGRLFAIAGGVQSDVERAAPLLDAFSQKRFHVGERPETANVVKLSGNFLIASMIESLGEALALVDKSGVAPRAFVDIITSTLFDAPVYRTYGALIAEQRFEPAGFAAPLGLKDVRLALAAGEDLRVPMPIASLLRDRFLALIAQGGERLDWSAIGRLAALDAGRAGALQGDRVPSKTGEGDR